MRILRLLLLFAYVTTQSGWALPLPHGAQMAGACGCGESCQCAQEIVKAGRCCCATRTASSRQTAPKSCCADRPQKSCCATKSGDDEQDQPLTISSCGCQHKSPSGMTSCSDPRWLADAVRLRTPSPAELRPVDADSTAPRVVRSPDDPVPRLTV